MFKHLYERLSGAVVRNLPDKAGDTRGGFDPWVGKVPGMKWQPTPVMLDWKIPWIEGPV